MYILTFTHFCSYRLIAGVKKFGAGNWAMIKKDDEESGRLLVKYLFCFYYLYNLMDFNNSKFNSLRIAVPFN
jgi:hypothetical protein